MADLYKSLIKPTWNKEQKFTGKEYEPLNTLFDGQTEEEILYRKQIAGLKALEKKTSYDAVNNFISMSRNKDLIFEDSEKKISSEVFSDIVNILNRGFLSSENSIKAKAFTIDKNGKKQYSFYSYSEQKENLKRAQEELKKALSQISLEGSTETKIIATVDKMLKNWKKNEYISEKALEIEDLLVDQLNASGFFAINSGAFYNAGKQLIEDAFAFKDKNQAIKDGIGFSIIVHDKDTKEDKTISNIRTIDDFFKAVNSLSGNYSVNLPDDLYEALQDISAITAQAKSGMGQSILNAGSKGRNAISLKEVGFNKNSFNLWKLYEQQVYSYRYFKDLSDQDESKTMTMLANYCLSKNIALTNLSKNKLYASEHGFQTASEWMESAKQFLKFSPSISKLDKNIYTDKRPYRFYAL